MAPGRTSAGHATRPCSGSSPARPWRRSGGVMSAKGYIVRLDEPGGSVFAVRAADTPRGVALTTHRERATEYPAVSEAVRGWWAMAFADARIFAVADDGTETPLPTYEE